MILSISPEKIYKIMNCGISASYIITHPLFDATVRAAFFVDQPTPGNDRNPPMHRIWTRLNRVLANNVTTKDSGYLPGR